MKNKFLVMLAVILSSFSISLVPQQAFAADFFGLPAWHRGLTDGDGIKKISDTGTGGVSLQTFFWTVVGNIIDALVRVVGYASVGFIVWAGFQYMTSGGNSSKVASAKTTLSNAIVGLIIAILASMIVQRLLGLF